jgi:hypothetical protein
MGFGACGLRRLMHPDTPIVGVQSSTPLVAVIAWVCFSVVPMLLAIDGLRKALYKDDLARLGVGFSGSIRESTCAVDSDRENILAAIGDDASSVDQSIRVLLKSGMSTESMRKGASLGIAVDRLSFVQLGPVFNLWAAWTVCSLGLFRPGLLQIESMSGTLSLQAAQIIYPVIHLILFIVSPRDAKVFSVYVAHKLLMWLVLLDGAHQMFVGSAAMYKLTCFAFNVFGILSFTISAMGLGRLASVPLFGKHCARLLIGKAPLVDVIRRVSGRAMAESESPSVRVSV